MFRDRIFQYHYFIIGILIPATMFIASAQETMVRGYELPSSHIEIISHRGANRLAPENTFASAREAIKSGTDYIEIDIRRSIDGVHYIISNSELEHTTNGSGLISDTHSHNIDRLDAGSWFNSRFVGEPVPRLYDFLKWVKGKAKVYLNIKDCDLNELIEIIYDLGFENDCLLGFEDPDMLKYFRDVEKYLVIKIDFSQNDNLDSLIQRYYPFIIEHDILDLTDEVIHNYHEKGLKVMTSVLGNDPDGYRKIIDLPLDMARIDSPNALINMIENNGVFRNFRLIAHRGGITGGQHGAYNEFDPSSIQKAIDMGYFMIEVDVNMTKDSVLIVHHDKDFTRFFNDKRRVDEILWEDVQKLKSDKNDYHPLSFDELARMCSGKVKLMIDTKAPRTPGFLKRLEDIMEKYDLLDGAYFLGSDIEMFMDRAKMSINMGQIPRLMEMLENGENVSRHYFLFSSANKLTSSVIKLAQKNYITVVAAVNIQSYSYENHWQGAKRDIEFMKECGVIEFQIDSHYDQWLPTGD